MQINNQQKESLITIFRQYKQENKDFKNPIRQLDFIKTAKQYLTIIKPFLEFSIDKTEDKDLQIFSLNFNEILDNPRLNELSELIQDLERGIHFGSHIIKRKITEIVKENLNTLENLQILMQILSADDKTEKTKLKGFEIEDD